MKECVGKDLFEYSVIAITTNGFVKGNGECVMGAGCAKRARDKWPGIAKKLGGYIKQYGNRCFTLGKYEETTVLTYVVKHNWWEDADPQLIITSAKQMVEMADKYGWQEVAIPRPGCGNGKLKWSDVRPLIELILDDRFVIVHK